MSEVLEPVPEPGRGQDSESQFRLLVDGVVDYAILALDVDGLVTSWNIGAERIKGYRPSEIIGQHFSVFYPPDDVAAGIPDAELIAATAKGSIQTEGWRVRKDGSQFWASVVITALFDDDHRLTGFAKLTRDITERRNADRRLRAAESIGRVGSWEMDMATTAIVRSETLLELYGIDPTATDGDFGSDLDRIHPDDRGRVDVAISVCRRTGFPFTERYRLFRENDGELRWFDVRGETIYENNQPVRLAGVVLDVTEQVQVAEVLEKARDVAVEASRQKSAFLATMSHEIRTPMNAVIGMTGLLLDTGLNDEQREFAETVRSSGDALLGIINDILDFSKIESGGLDLQLQQFDLRACVDDALDLVAVTADGKGLELVGQVDERCPDWLVGDVTRLRQVLVNLLGNAVKFTTDGEVVLTVAPVSLTEQVGDVALRFAVADSGIGIAADRLPSLFDPFSQVDGSTTRTYGGTGLGLAISHRLVQAMGATLGVESVSGVGSTFHFTVRLASVSMVEDRSDSKPSVGLGGRFALVVDDNATNRRILRLQMEGWEMQVTEASSADAAITILASGERFDVAVVDMKMPGMSGVDLGARLRTSPATMLLPLVLLSSHMERPSEADRDLFSAVLTKPVQAGKLQASLRRALAPGGSTNAGQSSQIDRKTGDQVLRLLVAEDNPVNQLVCRRLIEKLGHLVDVAGNGREAVEALRLAPYDAVLMDIQMPEMDGIEATRLIRSQLPANRQPHILAVTASVLVEDRQACAEAGMDDYLPKPVRIDDLATALRKVVPVRAG